MKILDKKETLEKMEKTLIDVRKSLIKMLLKKLNKDSFEGRKGSFGYPYNEYYLCKDNRILVYTVRLTDSFLGASYISNISNKKGYVVLSLDRSNDIYPANRPTKNEIDIIYQIFKYN